MRQQRIGIIMHGVTGRMGMNQHLIRSILEIMKAGGLELADGSRVRPTSPQFLRAKLSSRCNRLILLQN